MPTTTYPTTVPGILKIVEALLCLAGFISAMVPYWWTHVGGGWTQFVTITAVFGVVGILIAYTVLSDKLPAQMPLIVLIFYAVYSLFLLIAGILTAVRAGQLRWAALAACAFFVFAALVVFVVDLVMSLKSWRAGGGGVTMGESHTTTSHTSTTKTTVTVS